MRFSTSSMRTAATRRPLVASVLILIVAWLAWRQTPFRGVGAFDALRILTAPRDSFAVDSWRSGDPERRGRMLADLVLRRRLVGQAPSEIGALLGPSECYVVQDGDPCYRLAIRGRVYELQLPVRYWESPVRVRALDLVSRPQRVP